MGVDKLLGIVYTIIRKGKESKTMYTVNRWNAVNNEWSYYNTFATYTEAVEEMERLERMFKGTWKIFSTN